MAIEPACCAAQGRGARRACSRGSSPPEAVSSRPRATHATISSPCWPVSSCGETKATGTRTGVITASRDLQSRSIEHPIIVAPLAATLPNVASSCKPHPIPTHIPSDVCFPVRKGIGSRASRPITTSTASAGVHHTEFLEPPVTGGPKRRLGSLLASARPTECSCLPASWLHARRKPGAPRASFGAVPTAALHYFGILRRTAYEDQLHI